MSTHVSIAFRIPVSDDLPDSVVEALNMLLPTPELEVESESARNTTELVYASGDTGPNSAVSDVHDYLETVATKWSRAGFEVEWLIDGVNTVMFYGATDRARLEAELDHHAIAIAGHSDLLLRVTAQIHRLVRDTLPKVSDTG